MIDVYIGSAEKFAAVEPVTEYHIRKHASEPVNIHWMRPGEHGFQPSGCTGFTNFRYAIPHLASGQFAIYLDVDMFLYADIAELWEYRRFGSWAALANGATEVMVVNCSMPCEPPETVHTHSKHQLTARVAKSHCIPLEWNCEDAIIPGMKLLHFTDLKRQPWAHPGAHPLEHEWLKLKQEADENQRY